MSSMAATTGVVEATDRRHPRTARETARWLARAPELGGPQEGNLEGPVLRLRQGWKRVLEDRLEEVTQGGVGKTRLRLDRAA